MINVKIKNINTKDGNIRLSGAIFLSPSKTIPKWVSKTTLEFALSGILNNSLYIDEIKSFIIIYKNKKDRKIYDYLLKNKQNYLTSQIKISYRKASAF